MESTMTHCRLLVVSIVLTGFGPGSAGAEQPPRLPHAEAHAAGMDAARLDAIDGVVAEGLRQGRMPGCVVLVGRHGKVVFLRAYGYRQVEPDKAPMTTDTLFDLASLTKPIATATSVMRLVE
jgi:CubicO group peptidase (beta-lactamase class C family)